MNPEVRTELAKAKAMPTVEARMAQITRLRNIAQSLQGGYGLGEAMSPQTFATHLYQAANELDSLGALVLDIELPPPPEPPNEDIADLRNREGWQLERVLELALKLASMSFSDDTTNPHAGDEADMYEDYLRDKVIEYADAIKARRAQEYADREDANARRDDDGT